MQKPKDNRKKVFTALATVKIADGVKKLQLYSPQHFQAKVNELVLERQYGITIEEYKASRSAQQLAFYWVLLGYLASYTGYTPEELHEAIMRQKFGVRIVTVGGFTQTVRKSISDIARFPKSDMVDLIDEVLRIAQDLGVIVPTKEELGYL